MGPRQGLLLRLLLLHHGGLSAGNVPPLTRQGRSLAARGLVRRTESGSLTLTVAGREAAEDLWAERR